MSSSSYLPYQLGSNIAAKVKIDLDFMDIEFSIKTYTLWILIESESALI